MPVYNRLTDRSQVSAVTVNDIFHVVVTGDTSQSPQGSSYYAPISFLQPILSGASGTHGTSGTSGSSGSSGTSGTQGSSGSSGTSGTSGSNGSSGSSGTSGTRGSSGSSGTTGSSGSSGSSGTSGTTGTSGSSGSSGTSGTTGSSGSSGTAGTSGLSFGTSGTSGSSGTSGTSGISGTQGAAGSSGSSGSSGTSGTRGSSGSSGTSGTSGTSPLPSQVNTVENTGNTKFYITFVDSNNAVATPENVYTNTGISYNPSTDILELITGYRSGDGTVSAPPYSFIADTNTGMYRSGADELSFATGGSRRFYINSSGFSFFPIDNSSSPVVNIGSGNQIQFLSTSSSSQMILFDGLSLTNNIEITQFPSYSVIYLNKDAAGADLLNPSYILNGALSGSTNFGVNGGLPDVIIYHSGSTSLPTFNSDGLYLRGDLSVDGGIRLGTPSGSGVAVYRNAGTGILSVTSSDERLKTNIIPITGATDIISNLQGVYFTWVENEDFNPSDDTTQIGLIAQQVEEFLPEAVTNNGVKDYKTVKYSEMVALLIEGIKEQNETIKTLQNEIESIKSRLGNL